MAVAFGNVAGTHYQTANAQQSTDLPVTKPTATVDGTVQLIIGAFKAQTAGTHIIANFANETVVQSANSATLFNAAVIWRPAFTADGSTVDYNHTSGDAHQRSALVMTLTGANLVSAIRAFGTPASGNGTSATSPDTTAATAGDLIARFLVWFDDGDTLTVTHPGSHTSIAADFKPGAADGLGIATSFTTSAGGTPGTAAWTISSARDYVAFTTVIAAASVAGMTRPQAGIGSGGMSDMGGGMQGKRARGRIVVPIQLRTRMQRYGARHELRA